MMICDGKYKVNSNLENLKFSYSVNHQDSSKIKDENMSNATKFLEELTALTQKCGIIIKGPENGTSEAIYIKQEHDQWVISEGEYHIDDNLKNLSFSAPYFR
jgi:hypothetical protein